MPENQIFSSKNSGGINNIVINVTDKLIDTNIKYNVKIKNTTKEYNVQVYFVETGETTEGLKEYQASFKLPTIEAQYLPSGKYDLSIIVKDVFWQQY